MSRTPLVGYATGKLADYTQTQVDHCLLRCSSEQAWQRSVKPSPRNVGTLTEQVTWSKAVARLSTLFGAMIVPFRQALQETLREKFGGYQVADPDAG